MITELVPDNFLLSIANKHQCYCLQCVVPQIIWFLVIIIQCIVKIGLVTEIFIPNYQSLFFKLTQVTELSQKNLGKPRLRFFFDATEGLHGYQ